MKIFQVLKKEILEPPTKPPNKHFDSGFDGFIDEILVGDIKNLAGKNPFVPDTKLSRDIPPPPIQYFISK